MITPGIRFLIRGLLKLTPPIVITTIVLRSRLDVPSWVLISSALSVPAYYVSRILWHELQIRREAASVGARPVPRVKGMWWFGHIDVLFDMMRGFEHGYIGDGLPEQLEKYGNTFNIWPLWEDVIMTVEPYAIKTMLASDFSNYVKGEPFRESMDCLLGTGVFNSDGDMWKFHRHMTRPFFSRDRITHFDVFDRHAEDALDKMKQRLSEGSAVDFQDLVARFTLDSATAFLFGTSVCSLSAGLPYPCGYSTSQNGTSEPQTAESFSRSFLQIQYLMVQRQRWRSIWPLFELFGDKSKEPMRVVNAFIEPIIETAVQKHRLKQEYKTSQKNGVDEDEDTLLGSLLEMTNDPKVLKDETLNILLAGRDTTAATLTLIVYFLAIYPDVLTRLRAEVLAKVGKERRPTFEDIRDMKYLRAVINETMRLYPVVPFNIRETVNATTWPSPIPGEKPFYIPAKTQVYYSVLAMHRRKDLWGPDAEEFDPDRFLDERLKRYLVPNPFIFLPFNAGPRICMGQQFAYNEMSFFLIRLLQTFCRISLDPDSQPPGTLPPDDWKTAPGRKGIERFWPKSHLTVYSHGGLWVKMGEAAVDAIET